MFEVTKDNTNVETKKTIACSVSGAVCMQLTCGKLDVRDPFHHASFYYTTPVSYTHLDVYKRQGNVQYIQTTDYILHMMEDGDNKQAH